MKYVIVEHPLTGFQMPIVFPDDVCHADMIPPATRAVSAGFVTLLPSIKCDGYSDSLKIESRPELDALLVSHHIVLGLTITMQALPMEDQLELGRAAYAHENFRPQTAAV
jgi:hypothetical protein